MIFLSNLLYDEHGEYVERSYPVSQSHEWKYGLDHCSPTGIRQRTNFYLHFCLQEFNSI